MAENPDAAHAKSTIRTFALICVAVTSCFTIGMGIWYTFILKDPDWCRRAIGATKDVNETPGGNVRPDYAVNGCFDLLKQQVDAIALNSHIFAVTISVCLAVLMVIVVAGGRLSFTASKTGASANIGRDDGQLAPAPPIIEEQAPAVRHSDRRSAPPRSRTDETEMLE